MSDPERAPPILPVDPEAKTRLVADVGRVVDALHTDRAPLPLAPLMGACFDHAADGMLVCSIAESALDFYSVDLEDIARTSSSRRLLDDRLRDLGAAGITVDYERHLVEISLHFTP